MITIKRNKKRLRPGGCVLFFQEKPELFQDLKDGLEVEVPSIHQEEVLSKYLGLVEIVKTKEVKTKPEKKSKKLDIEEDVTEVAKESDNG